MVCSEPAAVDAGSALAGNESIDLSVIAPMPSTDASISCNDASEHVKGGQAADTFGTTKSSVDEFLYKTLDICDASSEGSEVQAVDLEQIDASIDAVVLENASLDPVLHPENVPDVEGSKTNVDSVDAHAHISSDDDNVYVDALVTFEEGRAASKRIWDSWLDNVSKSGKKRSMSFSDAFMKAKSSKVMVLKLENFT